MSVCGSLTPYSFCVYISLSVVVVPQKETAQDYSQFRVYLAPPGPCTASSFLLPGVSLSSHATCPRVGWVYLLWDDSLLVSLPQKQPMAVRSLFDLPFCRCRANVSLLLLCQGKGLFKSPPFKPIVAGKEELCCSIHYMQCLALSPEVPFSCLGAKKPWWLIED